MKITSTTEQHKAIITALNALNVRPFRHESGDPKKNAQRNLDGKSHYVDDDTLRFHYSRVNSTTTLADGLLFSITTTDAIDMRNTRRGHRCAVFDLFGNCVWRPELAQASKSGDQARKVRDEQEIDVAAHYAAELVRQFNQRADDLSNLETVRNTVTQLAQR